MLYRGRTKLILSLVNMLTNKKNNFFDPLGCTQGVFIGIIFCFFYAIRRLLYTTYVLLIRHSIEYLPALIKKREVQYHNSMSYQKQKKREMKEEEEKKKNPMINALKKNQFYLKEFIDI